MQREHHQALTKNYVLLVNERPVGKVLDELAQNKILDDEMREFTCHHPTRKGRTRALMGILPRRGPEAFHAFRCVLLSLKRDDLVKVLTNPDTDDVDMSFQEQSMKVLTNPDTEDMEMCFPIQQRLHSLQNTWHCLHSGASTDMEMSS
jgi:caspase 2